MLQYRSLHNLICVRSVNRFVYTPLSYLGETERGGGLIRVMNKRQEFLWVHEMFAGEY